MTVEYKNALAEVDYILGITSEEIIKKIPKSLLDFIKAQKTKNYQFSLNDELSLVEQPLKKETRAIISLIYRSYLCSSEQSKKNKIDDIIELKKHQLKLDEMYSYENVFKKNKKIKWKNSNTYLMLWRKFTRILG